jgi:hypothetical protein
MLLDVVRVQTVASAPVERRRQIVHLDRQMDSPMSCAPGPGIPTQAGQTLARVNVTCVTPLGEEVASTW